MKFYYAYLAYSYNTSEAGYYKSPYFTTRELAEEYAEEAKKTFKSYDGWSSGDLNFDEIYICECEVLDKMVSCKPKFDKNVVFT